MRMAGAELLPYDFTGLADTVNRYVDDLHKLWKATSDHIKEQNRAIEEGLFTATSDVRRPTLPPKMEAVPPHLNFAPLENGASALAASAQRYEKALAKGTLAGRDLSAINRRLIQMERGLLDPAGLPRRPWFRHQLYAPGFYTGYGVKTIPGVREAIEQKLWNEADAQIARVGKVLANEARMIEEAAAELER
jgi:N-acetylated-alpha-linked acidic dipeptidase